MKPIAYSILAVFLSACSGPELSEGDFGSRPPTSAATLQSDASEVDGVPRPVTVSPAAAFPNPRLAAFLGGTYQDVLRASKVAGAGIDGEIALGFAEDICELDIDKANAGPTSKDDLRAFKASFCAGRHRRADIDSRLGVFDRAAEAGDREAEVLQLALSATDDLTAEELNLISNELSALIRTTESPYILRTAGGLLYSEPFYNVVEDRDRPPGMNDENLMLARQFGVELAVCDRYRYCGPNSLMAKRFCMPSQCAPGQDVKGYVRRQLPEAVYLEAVRFSGTFLR